MKTNKNTTTPKQQEQQQEQLREHQQQSPATNGIKQPPFSDTSRASAALSSASPSFIAQFAVPSCLQKKKRTRTLEQDQAEE